ncbi:MAG: glycoside hydrolase family 25 protein [Lachnospiraceae bacterium]
MRRILAAGLAFAAVIVIAFSAYHIMGKDAEPIAVQATTEAPMRETMEALIPETETPMASETPAESAPVAVDVADLDDAEDPQAQENEGDGEGSGAEVDMNQMIQQEAASQQSTERSNGIDVSKYQGKIDWQQVKTAGIDFAMVRVGYRTQKTGILYEDPYARYNLQEAQKAGIQMGAYFFSTAVTEQEALEEAMWVCDFISQYEIHTRLPIIVRGFKSSENRQYSLTKEERTGLAQVFLNYIEERGYTPMFYAAKNELSGSVDLDTEELENRYQIWVSQYPAVPYPETAQSSYEGSHQMWQYTSQGTVTGISKPVDVNVAYFAYDETAQAKNPTPPEVVEDSPELGIIFTDTREEVTAKIKTNENSPNSSDPKR